MRKITQEMVLNALRGYRWEVGIVVAPPAPVGDGKAHAQITEVYVCTDDNYTAVPEGQKRNILTLTAAEQTAVDNFVRKYLLQAVNREQMDKADVTP